MFAEGRGTNAVWKRGKCFCTNTQIFWYVAMTTECHLQAVISGSNFAGERIIPQISKRDVDRNQ